MRNIKGSEETHNPKIFPKSAREIGLWCIGLGLAFFGVSTSIGLLCGLVLASFLDSSLRRSAQKISKYLLQTAVALLGAGLQLSVILQVGANSVGVTLVSIIFTIFLGLLISQTARIDLKLGTLLSGGTAICGGSAIAALSPSIHATARQTASALLVIFLLNAIGLFIFPTIGSFFELTEAQFGLWSALAIHDTSSVVGAASQYGDEALMIATTVKLTRALWIIPISLVSAHLCHGQSKASIPWFLVAFLGMAFLRFLFDSSSSVIAEIGIMNLDRFAFIGKSLMVSALFFIGASLSWKDLYQLGFRPLVVAILLWLIVSITTLYLICSSYLMPPILVSHVNY